MKPSLNAAMVEACIYCGRKRRKRGREKKGIVSWNGGMRNKRDGAYPVSDDGLSWGGKCNHCCFLS